MQAVIARIREAFADCPRFTPEQLSPNGGIDASAVHENWEHLNREDVEKFEVFGDCLGEDLTCMSSVATRYFMPSLMILFLAHPERIDPGGFFFMLHKCERLFKESADSGNWGRVALTQAQADAFRDWIREVLAMIHRYDRYSPEEQYERRIRELMERVGNSPPPDTDSDADTLFMLRQKYPFRGHNKRKAKRNAKKMGNE